MEVAQVPNSDENDAVKPNWFKVKKPTVHTGVSGLNGPVAKFKPAPIHVSRTLTVTPSEREFAMIHTPLNEAKHQSVKAKSSSPEFVRVVL